MLPGQTLPGLHFPNSLEKLVLEECGLPWSAMSTIGSLPHLEVLKLRKSACVGATWHLGDGEFPALKYLELFDLDIEQVDNSACDGKPFSSLVKLMLIRCLGLEDLPLPVTHYLHLETIDISGSPSISNSLKRFMNFGESLSIAPQVVGLDSDDVWEKKKEGDLWTLAFWVLEMEMALSIPKNAVLQQIFNELIKIGKKLHVTLYQIDSRMLLKMYGLTEKWCKRSVYHPTD